MEAWDIETLSEEMMYAVEADSYWMLCKLLDGIQDHYTNAQPGIQRTVFKLKELVRWVCLFFFTACAEHDPRQMSTVCAMLQYLR